MTRPKLTYPKSKYQIVAEFLRNNFKIISLILVAILLLAATTTYFIVRSRSNQPVESVIEAPVLPSDWQIIEENQGNIIVKLQKKSDKSFLPTMILVSSQIKETDNTKKYIDTLIRGAKSTIPSLVYTSNKSFVDQNGVDNYQLQGYYYSNKQKISIAQYLYIKDQKIFTISLSSLSDQLSQEEINSLINNFLSDKISF